MPNAPPTDGQLRRKRRPELYRKPKTNANEIRKTSRWTKLSKMYRAAHPVCCDPLGLHKGRVEPTRHTHHIAPVDEAPELAYEWSNLAPLCHECHGAVEAMGRRGEDTKGLFRGLPNAG